MLQREMTLKEYVGQLPHSHVAHQEYTVLMDRLNELESLAKDLCRYRSYDVDTGNVLVETGFFNNLCDLVNIPPIT